MKFRDPVRVVCLAGVLSCVLAADPEPAAATPDLLAVLRFANQTGDARFNDFHLMLRKRFEYEVLMPGLPVKAWDATVGDIAGIDSADTARFRFVIFGSFTVDSMRREPVLEFAIVNKLEGAKTDKRLAIGGMNAAEVADIVVLKASDFLRRSLLGSLSVTSRPAACEILLDGVSTGVTPKEFALQAGTFDVEIRGGFFKPFRQRVEIQPGTASSIAAQMQFQGYPTMRWLAAALGATGITLIAWGVEENLHRAYRDLESDASRRDFTDAYDAYRSANAVRLVLQNLTVVPWTGTGFCFLINRSIKKRVMANR